MTEAQLNGFQRTILEAARVIAEEGHAPNAHRLYAATFRRVHATYQDVKKARIDLIRWGLLPETGAPTGAGQAFREAMGEPIRNRERELYEVPSQPDEWFRGRNHR